MNQKLSGLGWLVAGVIAMTMLASGFQTGQTKMAVVDMQRILSESKAGKKVRDDMSIQVNLRQGLLEFVNLNKVVTPEQANKLETLTLKDNPTQADKDELESLKATIRSESKKFESLMQKPSLSDTERAEFNKLADLRRGSDALLNDWNQKFSQQLSNMQDDMLAAVLKKARDAVQGVGKKDGYTVVFPTTVAVYASNDVTDAAIKAVDESN